MVAANMLTKKLQPVARTNGFKVGPLELLCFLREHSDCDEVCFSHTSNN